MNTNYQHIKVIGFDADDTLWVNETYFREAEEEFASLLSGFETKNKIDQELFKKEIENLSTYGYGVKGFTLSMVEMAIELSNNTISNQVISKILDIGKRMIHEKVELLEGVESVLKELSQNYRLIVATKGDLVDQERKLEKSGLLDYFHHIEVLSDKKEGDYTKLLNHLDIKPSEFLMVGNSLKSDVLPLVNIGAKAIHVPFHTTWEHEQVKVDHQKSKTYETITRIIDVLKLLN